MIAVTSTIEMSGTPTTAWKVLTDLAQFARWNPFIRDARGSTELGGTVRVRVEPRLPVRLRFTAKVLESDAGRRLHWRGHVIAPWLASGDHTFTIEPLADNRIRFEQRETFGGLLPWLARRPLAREAKRGFDAMNDALARRIAAVEDSP